MTPSLQKILESKRALRRELAEPPVAEKSRMLEAMRERTVAIRGDGQETRRSSTRAK
jgi:hypothetical protein